MYEDKTAQVACRTIEILEDGGWIKEAYRVGESHCLVGAMRQAKDDLGIFEFGFADTLYNGICSKKGVSSIEYWNDRPETTYDDVINVLKEFCDVEPASV